MEQAVPRYHACFTVTAAALAGSTYQTSDGAFKRTQKCADLNLMYTPAGPSPRARHCMETIHKKFGRDDDPSPVADAEYKKQWKYG